MPAVQLRLRLRPARRRLGVLPDLSLIATPPLRNNNRRGNPNAAPRCGARTRAGGGCLCPAMRNGRCRMHGGASTGPRTAEGRARIARARTKHGRYSAAARERREVARVRRAAVRDRVAETQALLQGAFALSRRIRRGLTPSMLDTIHLAACPFLPPALRQSAAGSGPDWDSWQDLMHREGRGDR